MQAATTAPQVLPPEAIVMQMVMGGWVARAICTTIPAFLRFLRRFSLRALPSLQRT